MTANQEVPPTTSSGSGNVSVVVTNDGDGGYLATMSGLVSGFGSEAPNAVHLHHAHAGLSGSFLGGIAGNFIIVTTLGVASVSGATPYTAADVLEIIAGRAYVNFHSTLNPGGAVRGQLLLPGEELWSAQLSGAASIPPSPYAAGLAGVGFIVSADGGVAYQGSWPADVEATAAHVHLGDSATNGPVVIGLTVAATSGVMGTLSTQQLDAGPDQYVNVHTTDAGDGLIRGQLVKH